MKYVCLVYSDENDLENIPDAECIAFNNVLREQGHCLAAEVLAPVQTSTTVRVRNSKISITDAPYAKTDEQLSGFYLIDARDLNEAIRVASKIPPARVGSIEVRPVRKLKS